MNKDVISAIADEKIIIIVRGVTGEKLTDLATALYEGGIRLMEITYAADKPETDLMIADNIASLAEMMKGKMYIGAGTVTRREQVELTRRAGGKFIISPDTAPEIISCTKAAGLVSIPGALTPTEITMAHRCGADFVKLFPANLHGPEYVKALKAPLSHVKLLAVGGVDETNIPSYAAAGVDGFGIGTKFGDPQLLKTGNYTAITSVVKKYVSLVKKS